MTLGENCSGQGCGQLQVVHRLIWQCPSQSQACCRQGEPGAEPTTPCVCFCGNDMAWTPDWTLARRGPNPTELLQTDRWEPACQPGWHPPGDLEEPGPCPKVLSTPGIHY